MYMWDLRTLDILASILTISRSAEEDQLLRIDLYSSQFGIWSIFYLGPSFLLSLWAYIRSPKIHDDSLYRSQSGVGVGVVLGRTAPFQSDDRSRFHTMCPHTFHRNYRLLLLWDTLSSAAV